MWWNGTWIYSVPRQTAKISEKGKGGGGGGKRVLPNPFSSVCMVMRPYRWRLIIATLTVQIFIMPLFHSKSLTLIVTGTSSIPLALDEIVKRQ